MSKTQDKDYGYYVRIDSDAIRKVKVDSWDNHFGNISFYDEPYMAIKEKYLRCPQSLSRDFEFIGKSKQEALDWLTIKIARKLADAEQEVNELKSLLINITNNNDKLKGVKDIFDQHMHLEGEDGSSFKHILDDYMWDNTEADELVDLLQEFINKNGRYQPKK